MNIIKGLIRVIKESRYHKFVTVTKTTSHSRKIQQYCDINHSVKSWFLTIPSQFDLDNCIYTEQCRYCEQSLKNKIKYLANR